MATMNVWLPESMQEFVEGQAEKEGFGSVSEYLRSVIREIQKREARRELAAKLLDGLQGPAVEMNREDWDSIRREALEGLSGEEVRL